MSTIIRAIKIKLGQNYAEVPGVGLYINEFRISESPLTGVTEQYTSGLLFDSGKATKRADCRTGGCQAQVSDVTIIMASVVEIDGTPYTFESILNQYGINLRGKVVEIKDFVGTDSDSDATEIENVFLGCIENYSQTETRFIITAKSSMALRRNANLGEIDSKNNSIPVTFGSSDPVNGRYFKAIRANAEEIKLKVEDLAQKTGNYEPADTSLFPVVAKIGSTPSKIYDVRLMYMDATACVNLETYLVNKWILAREGTGNGQWARIKTATLQGSGQAYIRLEFYNYLKTDLAGNWTGDLASNGTSINSWINIIDLDKLYKIDSIECRGFFDADGNFLDKLAEIYLKDNDNQVKRIPHFGYDIRIDGHNNSMIINPELFESNSDTMVSFLFLPVSNFARAYETTSFGIPSIKVADGVFFVGPDAPISTVITPTELEDTSVLFDKSISGYCSTKVEVESPSGGLTEYIHAYSFKMPKLPENFTFTNVYLGIYGTIDTTVSTNRSTKIDVAHKGYINRAKVESTGSINYKNGDMVHWDNIPDFYIERNLNNIQFNTSGSSVLNPGGFTMIDLNIVNSETYDGINEALISFTSLLMPAFSWTVETKIHEMFIMIKSTASIKDALYV